MSSTCRKYIKITHNYATSSVVMRPCQHKKNSYEPDLVPGTFSRIFTTELHGGKIISVQRIP